MGRQNLGYYPDPGYSSLSFVQREETSLSIKLLVFNNCLTRLLSQNKLLVWKRVPKKMVVFLKGQMSVVFMQLQNVIFIYLFGVLRHFQHCTGHIMTGSCKGRGNQYIEFVRVLYCKLPTNGKQLPAFPLEAMPGIEPRPQRWEARVLPLCHHGPFKML